MVVAPNGVQGSKYKATPVDEAADAWVRYIKATTAKQDYEVKAATPEGSGDNKGKYKTTSNVAQGMMQTIDAFSAFTAPAGTDIIAGEPMGTAATRYVKVLLTHLDMSDLHVKSDKQLRDVVRVWDKLGLDAVTVYLDGGSEDDEDGDAAGEFTISQKTIKTINDINIAKGGLPFKVKPCVKAGEACTTIIVKGGADIQDVAFIAAADDASKADVAFNVGETWNWKGAVKVNATATGGVKRFINRGTMVNTEGAILKTTENDGTQNNVVLVNNGTWNISGGKLFVQFNVTNLKDVNIAKGAEYRQDNSNFTNAASAIPTRFGGDDSKIGKVVNNGVFATVNSGNITNVGLIKHDDIDAKTYITSNQIGGNFNTPFGATNKMGRINLKYSNKDEDNISISAAADQGFVSVTIDGEVSGTLNATAVGTYVNYVIVNSGVTEIAALPEQIKYVEIADKNNTEIAWNLSSPANASYLGLMVLSPVNIKLGTTIQIWDGTTAGTGACYLGADMYVGGTFNNGSAGTLPSWNGYYGNTTSNFATKYVTY